MAVAIVAAAGYVVVPLAGAALADLPKTQVKGRSCYYYDVQPRESIYGVSEKLGVTREAILRHNPSAADGLKPKMRLFSRWLSLKMLVKRGRYTRLLQE